MCSSSLSCCGPRLRIMLHSQNYFRFPRRRKTENGWVWVISELSGSVTSQQLGAQDSVTTRLLWLLDSMISFPSVACFQMIWDERLCDILSQDRKLGDHKYSHNDSVVTSRMIKFILMMMIILILMETSTTNRLMETFSSDTKQPTIILRSSVY